MYKNYTKKPGVLKRTCHKALLIMRLTSVLLLACFLQVSASTFGQLITVNQQNAQIESVLKEIRKQSGYDFFYKEKVFPQSLRVNLSVANVTVEEALNKLMTNLPLTYEINGKKVAIKAKRVTVAAMAIEVRGVVKDEKGNNLSGATIRVKGTSNNAVTGSDGSFVLRNVPENAMLEIVYVGYATREVRATANIGEIRMAVATSELQELTVVNTGYQTLSKERATGSFNTISKEQLDKPSTNIAQRLIGTTAGMQAILDADGNPRFEIRGQTTLNIRDVLGTRNPSAAPLVVVDGFAIQGDFSTINPNDVETVTILKDAAAASIWGARSANGVIVVVTKKAKAESNLRIDFSAFTRISKKLDLDYVNPLATSAQTVDYELRSFGNWSANLPLNSNTSFGALSPATVAIAENYFGITTLAQRDAMLAKYSSLSNKDQIRDELLANPSAQQYNLSISGASAKMRNNMSLLFEDGQSNFKGTNSKKYTANYRTSIDLFKWMEFDFSGMVNYNKGNNNGVSLGDIQGISPYEMLRNDDGSLANIARYYMPNIVRYVPTQLFPYTDWTYNPIQEIANRHYTSEQLNTRLQTGLKFKVIPGLSFDSRIQYELFNTINKEYNNENTFAVRSAVNQAASWNRTTNVITLNLPKGGILRQGTTNLLGQIDRPGRGRAETYNWRNQLNFDRRFGEKHELNFVAGSEINNIKTENHNIPLTYGYNENTLSVGTFPRGIGGPFAPITNWTGGNQTFTYTNLYSYNTDRYFSLYANMGYTFNNKYTVSGSVRTDASNLITDDPSYRYEPLWSAGVLWQAKRESFMQDINWLDQLTVRATYGYNGNVDKSTSFRPLINLAATPNLYTNEATARIQQFGNPSLRWEKTGQLNLAIDYSLFGGKLYGKVDLYNKQGKDLIATISIPAINGTTSQLLNNAEMNNRGIEIELGTTQNLGSKVVWRGNFNFAYNRNKVTKLFVANYAASTLVGGGSGAYVEGEDANSLWRFRYAGMLNTQPTVYGPSGGATPIVYDFGAFTPGDGRTYLKNMGTTIAPYTLGFINSFQIQDFNLSFIFTGKFGHVFQRKGFNYPAQFGSRISPNVKLAEVLSGDPSKIVPLPQNLIEPRYYFWDRFHQYLDYLVEDASHIRMQEVNLSYNLPSRLVSKLNLNRVRVYAQGNDLFTWFANDAGEDPEYLLGTLNPQPRVTLGINFGF
ncbi:TonB-dependent Receptor Plug Domain protein [compost metagenome]